MKLPLAIVQLLYSQVYLRALGTPYFHLPGYMLRHWVFGDRSPERNADNERWHGRRGGWLYRMLARLVAVRAHTILRSDADRALHDHPFASVSIVLKGGYWEVCEPNEHARALPAIYALLLEQLPWLEVNPRSTATAASYNVHWRGPGSVVFRRAAAAHRLVLPGSDGRDPGDEAARTLFVMGAKCQGWGFYPHGTEHAKVPWREYLSDQANRTTTHPEA
jgi:hypothetical protein